MAGVHVTSDVDEMDCPRDDVIVRCCHIDVFVFVSPPLTMFIRGKASEERMTLTGDTNEEVENE